MEPIALVPMLDVQRRIYDLPPGRGRFERYLAVMTDPVGELALPLPAFNPMGKAHVAATLDALLALGAEDVAAKALAGASPRLVRAGGNFRVGLVVADDLGGGWTNRFTTEVDQRFRSGPMLKRGWAVALFWTSEPPTAESVAREALAAAFRAAYAHRHGPATTLRRMMAQEGPAAAFAGASKPPLDAEELAYTAEVLRPHLDSDDFPALFACLHGDAAARALGYDPLGLVPRAGYALALAEALARPDPPEATLD